MFYGQSDAKRKTLMEVQQYFRYADSHPSITLWRTKAMEDFGFYDGTGQWPKSILEDLRRRNQFPVTVNKIKNLVNYMSGVEIQTRFRVAYRDDSGNPDNELLAFDAMDSAPQDDMIYYFAGIDAARFKRPVEPGDQLILQVELLRMKSGIFKFKASALVDDELAVEADITCAVRKMA